MIAFLQKATSKFTIKNIRIAVISLLFCSMALTLTGVSSGSKALHVFDGNTTQVIYTRTDDIQLILSKNIELGEHDEYTFTGFNSENEGNVYIHRAFNVYVEADGEKHTIPMATGTVEDALEKAGVGISEDDLINVPLEEDVVKNSLIVINRVEYETYDETVVLEYETQEVETDTLAKGRRVVEVKGENGELQTTYRRTIVDGEESAVEAIGQVVTKEPVAELVKVGTKETSAVQPAAGQAPASTNGTSGFALPAGVTLDANGIPTNYSRVLTGRATAYTAPAGAKMSTGVAPSPGYVAVDPRIIPYGTKMYIVTANGSYTYGYAVAGDTGGALRQGRALVDLYMNTTAECFAFGSRTVNVYIFD